ncbi:MAG: TonB-dependent receptor plug domain-containing protein, partial [Flavobacteriaceae bacterium]|nr:TonB-dependent receptor plug domain-containing protein [Flavobacteriaceae bacterium]
MKIKLTHGLFSHLETPLRLLMRIFILLCCTTVFSLTPKDLFSQSTRITVQKDQEVTVDEVFEMISHQTKYSFMYQSDMFRQYPKVQLKKGTVRMDRLINQSLTTGNINIVLTSNNTIIIRENKDVVQFSVSGTVVDEKGLPIPGATILIKGTTKGASADFDGKYTITVSHEANVLVFSSLGYQSQEITVGQQRIIDVQLKEAVSELDEVVLNAGYYKTSQRKATGNIARIDKKTIENQPVSNPIGALQGYVSGVDIRQTTGVPGGGFEIEIRGRNFINGGTNPLFIVDGVPFSSESLEASRVGSQINQANVSPLNALNPQDIESIEILKEADATAIYGSRGANGVVLITTKKGKAGKAQFTANLSTSLGQVSQFRDLMNTHEYLEVRREGVIWDNYGPFLEDSAFDFVWPDLKTWDQDRYTDWQKELIGGTAFRNNVQLSVSGGSDQTQFLISGAHQKQTTVFPGDSNYKKTSVHSNINHRSKDGRFAMNFSTNYAIENNDLVRQDLTR